MDTTHHPTTPPAEPTDGEPCPLCGEWLEDSHVCDPDTQLLYRMNKAGIDEDMIDAVKAYEELGTRDDDLSDFEESYVGKFSSDEEFAEDMAEQMGDMNFNAIPWPLTCIDWQQAAKELMYDYSESNGHYFRNI